MRANRVQALFLACGLAGCATLTRGDRAELVLRRAPEDLQVIANGKPLELQKVAADQNGVTYRARVDYKTEKLTLRSGGVETMVDARSTVPVGFLVVDYLLLAFPVLIDMATMKWRNFEELVVADALVAGRKQVPPASAAPRAAPAAYQPGKTAPAAAPVAAAAAQRALVDGGKLAVLDFKNYTQDLKPEDVRYFSDVVRGATLRASPRLQVMTRENLLVLLEATGKDASQCEGECEVDTGRRIGADAVVSGELLKVGSRYKMSLRLHETHDGRLLSTAVASGKSIDELDESAQQAARDLLLPRP